MKHLKWIFLHGLLRRNISGARRTTPVDRRNEFTQQSLHLDNVKNIFPIPHATAGFQTALRLPP
jgi:hypothetical protein